MKRTVLSAMCIAVVLCAEAKLNPLPLKPYVDTSTSKPELTELFADIILVSGIKSPIILKEADVLNLEAAISHRKRLILYNPKFINWLYKATNDKWAATALLAHELGHHLYGHTLKKRGSRPAVELEADEFAGLVLFKLGATLDQAQEVMKHITTISGSSTHPGRLARMDAIKRGWESASL